MAESSGILMVSELKAIGEVLFFKKRFADAIRVFEKVLELDPSLNNQFCANDGFPQSGLEAVVRMKGTRICGQVFKKKNYIQVLEQMEDPKIPRGPEYDDQDTRFVCEAVIVMLSTLVEKLEANCGSSDDPKVNSARLELTLKRGKEVQDYRERQLKSNLLLQKMEQASMQESTGKVVTALDHNNAADLLQMAKLHYDQRDYKSCSNQCIAAIKLVKIGKCNRELLKEISKLLNESLSKLKVPLS